MEQTRFRWNILEQYMIKMEEVTNNTTMKESFVRTLKNYFENKSLIMASTVGIKMKDDITIYITYLYIILLFLLGTRNSKERFRK
jgi:hypothetical protein